MVSVLLRVALMIVFLVTCCLAITCSYIQLNRKYQRLENKSNKLQNWIERLKSDSESGGVKHAFAAKMSQLNKNKNKLRKDIQKLAKSGTQGIKQAVQKQMKKRSQPSEHVPVNQIEEFDVEIDDM
mmetsp:Transcript_17392/g.29260  ORF Transcript_17392/g.29260 Transcript_17392/m.29260 type:complete len:126 (-) Transcript_17392:46-423(-)